MRPSMTTLVTAALLASVTAAAQAPDPAGRRTVAGLEDDLAHRSHDIHWPAGFSPEEADTFAHNQAVISATCERVWQHLIAAAQWPKWYPNSKTVEILGGAKELNRDSIFSWTTFGVSIESRINEFVPFTRIGWYAYSPGSKPSIYHTWFLKQVPNGCLVVTEEVGKGYRSKQQRNADEEGTHRAHDLWIAALKRLSEGT